jgi:hypothetical protein
VQKTPTPQEARAALTEAGVRAQAVWGADTRFRPILLVLAAADVGIGVLLGFNPRGEWRYGGVVLLAIYLGAIIATGVLVRRPPARSRAAGMRFFLACVVFFVWNAAMIAVSVASGWWGASQPGFHVTVSFAVAALPLVVAAWLIGPPRR